MTLQEAVAWEAGAALLCLSDKDAEVLRSEFRIQSLSPTIKSFCDYFLSPVFQLLLLPKEGGGLDQLGNELLLMLAVSDASPKAARVPPSRINQEKKKWPQRKCVCVYV